MSDMPMIEEADATGEVAEMYDDIQKTMGISFVPMVDKALAISPNALRGTWEVSRHVLLNTNLPMSLAAMILFSVSSANKCE